MNTNLLTHYSHHRRQIETFTTKLTPSLKLKETAGLTHNTFRFYDDVSDSYNQPLCKCWSVWPKPRENILAENPPTAHVGVTSNKHKAFMNYPSLSTHSCNPKERCTYHPDDIVGKTNEMTMAGIKDLNLHNRAPATSPPSTFAAG